MLVDWREPSSRRRTHAIRCVPSVAIRCRHGSLALFDDHQADWALERGERDMHSRLSLEQLAIRWALRESNLMVQARSSVAARAANSQEQGTMTRLEGGWQNSGHIRAPGLAENITHEPAGHPSIPDGLRITGGPGRRAIPSAMDRREAPHRSRPATRPSRTTSMATTSCLTPKVRSRNCGRIRGSATRAKRCSTANGGAKSLHLGIRGPTGRWLETQIR
jgi:hypothetical protein